MSGEDGYSSSGNNSGSSSSSISDGPWVEEFEDSCSSENLYLDELKSFIEGISLDDFDLSHSSFLHRACMNEKVTLEIVMYLLRLYPGTINTSFDISQTMSTLVFRRVHILCIWHVLTKIVPMK